MILDMYCLCSLSLKHSTQATMPLYSSTAKPVEVNIHVVGYIQPAMSHPVRVFDQCTLINFIATERGLEDQLLAKVVGVERPELEKQAQELQSAFNQVSQFIQYTYAPHALKLVFFFVPLTFSNV